MWTEDDLQELLAYSPNSPVLSVYLDMEPGLTAADGHKLHLRQLVRPYESEASDDIEVLIRYLEHEHGGSGRALALFTCQQDGFFRSYPLAVPVRSRARMLDHPYVKPLADLLDMYGHFGVILVDRQRARIFHLHLGEMIDHDEFIGEEVRHIKSGGGSQAAGRRGGAAGQTRYADEIAERNLRQAGASATQFFKEHSVRRIVLGGSEETIAFFLDTLPTAMRSLVVGQFAVSMNAGQHEIIELALSAAQDAEQRRQDKLVERIVTAAAKGDDGVISLDQTLEAVHSGRVQTLVLAEGFNRAGYRCLGCGYLTVQSIDPCPFCGSAFERIEDAVEMAVREVMEKGGDVEVVRQNETLEDAGRIGALLRY
jgi:peptide chain release factor subunit 1